MFQLGEVVDVKTSPGLYFKIPLAQNVRYFDSRILTFDTAEPERFITSEKKNVLVDLFVKWRIVDVKQYYISVRGDEMLAQTRLSQTVNSSLRDEFGNRTVHDVVSGERDKIMEIMRQKADADARKIGVEVRGCPAEASGFTSGGERIGLSPDGSGTQTRSERVTFDGCGGIRKNPRRCRPPARSHPRGSLPESPGGKR